jgi:hypothetical protein
MLQPVNNRQSNEQTPSLRTFRIRKTFLLNVGSSTLEWLGDVLNST